MKKLMLPVILLFLLIPCQVLGIEYGVDVLGGLGDCTTDFFDTVQAPWTHDAVNKEYDVDGSQGGNISLSESGILTAKVLYRIDFTIKNYVAGKFRIQAAGNYTGYTFGADGVYTEYLICFGGDYFSIRADSSFNGSVTNIFIYPILNFDSLSGIGGAGVSFE